MTHIFEVPTPEKSAFDRFMEGLEEYDKKCISINPFDMNEEFVKVPAQIAYWNAQLAQVIEEALEAKKLYDETKARIFIMIKHEGTAKGDRLTVADIDARVTYDVDVEEAHMEWIKAESKKIRVRGMVDALTAKKDMLQMLGSKLKTEMEHDPVLRDQMAGSSRYFYGGGNKK